MDVLVYWKDYQPTKSGSRLGTSPLNPGVDT
jgi:hypothetical protein